MVSLALIQHFICFIKYKQFNALSAKVSSLDHI